MSCSHSKFGTCHPCMKEELLKDPEFRREYEKFDLAFWLSVKWMEFRVWLDNLKRK